MIDSIYRLMIHLPHPLQTLLFICGLTFFFSPNVLGQGLPEIDVELRTDVEWMVSSDENSAYASEPGVLFTLPRAHLNINGNANEKFGYRLRLSWNKSFEPQADNTGIGLEYFYLKYQRNPALQIRIGKQRILQGGREGSYNPINVLRYSRIGARIQSLYEVGASLFYDLGRSNEELQNHALIGQVFNQTSGGGEGQLQPGLNFAWYSVIADGLLEPIIQYATISHSSQKEFDSSNNVVTTQESYAESFLSLGVLLNLDDFTVDIDLLNHNVGAISTTSLSGESSSEDQINETNFILFGSKDGLERSPFLKWIYEIVTGGTEEGNAVEIQLGYEFYPIIENKNFIFYTLVAFRQETHDGNNFDEVHLKGGIASQF